MPAALSDPLDRPLSMPVDAELFAHCVELAGTVSGLRTVRDLARALGGPEPAGAAVGRALDAVARQVGRCTSDPGAAVAVQCRLLALWALLADGQPIGRWIRYAVCGAPIVSGAFLRACATARVQRAGTQRFSFHADELSAHAAGFERVLASRRLH